MMSTYPTDSRLRPSPMRPRALARLRRLAVALSFAATLLGVTPSSHAGDTWVDLNSENTPTIPGNETQFITEGQDGRMWVGTMSGVAWVKDGEFHKVAGGQVWTVCEIAPDDVWIGHGGGAIHLVDGKAENFLKGNTVAPIIKFSDTELWAIAKDKDERSTLMSYKDGAWTPVEAFKDQKTSDVLKLANGRVWLMIDGNGVWEIDPAQPLDMAKHHLEGMNVTTVMLDSQQQVWAGLWGRGVMSYNGTAWTPYLPKEKAAILAIVQDGKGNIWASTSANGLWHFNREKWVNDLKDEGAINLLATTADGRVWVSSQTAGGLRYWDGKAWQVSLDLPLPIRCLVEARNGTLWAGGILDGLHLFKK